ncbi:MAG: hypothetical protein AB7P94_16670 [Steroidobacteraceae bacterium]
MSVTPKVHLVAYEDRASQFIFVAVPDQRGRYLRTDKSVALVPCPMCRAMRGEPCRGGPGDTYGGTTHAVRRTAAARFHGYRVDDVLQVELAPDGSEART